MIDLETLRSQQQIARQYVHKAIKASELKKAQCCEWCGSTIQIEGHHQDYAKPLEVKWLCSACHKRLHRELRKTIAEQKKLSRAEIIETASSAKTEKKQSKRA